MQPVELPALLREARDLAATAAREKDIAIVVVTVDELVHVLRAQVVDVVADLLRDGIAAAPPGGRVAVTAQSFERELVFAVYASGRRCRTRLFPTGLQQTARLLGGRVWRSAEAQVNLSLFAVPLVGEDLVGCEPIDDCVLH